MHTTDQPCRSDNHSLTSVVLPVTDKRPGPGYGKRGGTACKPVHERTRKLQTRDQLTNNTRVRHWAPTPVPNITAADTFECSQPWFPSSLVHGHAYTGITHPSPRFQTAVSEVIPSDRPQTLTRRSSCAPLKPAGLVCSCRQMVFEKKIGVGSVDWAPPTVWATTIKDLVPSALSLRGRKISTARNATPHVRDRLPLHPSREMQPAAFSRLSFASLVLD